MILEEPRANRDGGRGDWKGQEHSGHVELKKALVLPFLLHPVILSQMSDSANTTPKILLPKGCLLVSPALMQPSTYAQLADSPAGTRLPDSYSQGSFFGLILLLDTAP